SDHSQASPRLLPSKAEGDPAQHLYSPSSTTNPLRSPQSPQAIQWLDYDNDGDLDLYLTGHTLNESELLLNDGDGTFSLEGDVRRSQIRRGGGTESAASATINPATVTANTAHSISSTNSSTLATSDWADVDNNGHPNLLQPVNVGRANLT